MTDYGVYETNTFSEIYETLNKDERDFIDKIKEQLKTSPTGKILHFRWFREKKYLNKRLYFLIDYDIKKILLVSFGQKKDQQRIINFIMENMKELLKLLKNI